MHSACVCVCVQEIRDWGRPRQQTSSSHAHTVTALFNAPKGAHISPSPPHPPPPHRSTHPPPPSPALPTPPHPHPALPTPLAFKSVLSNKLRCSAVYSRKTHPLPSPPPWATGARRWHSFSSYVSCMILISCRDLFPYLWWYY